MTIIEIICCLGWLLACVGAYQLIVVCRALDKSEKRAKAWEKEARRFLDYGPES